MQHADPTVGFLHPGGDHDRPTPQRLVAFDLYLDGAHEPPPFLARMFASGVAEFLGQRFPDIGEPFEVRARVSLGNLSPDQIRVELYVGQTDDADELIEPVVVTLVRTGESGGTENGTAEFSGGFMPTGAGRFQYGVRVRPNLQDDTQLAHLGLVQWA